MAEKQVTIRIKAAGATAIKGLKTVGDSGVRNLERIEKAAKKMSSQLNDIGSKMSRSITAPIVALGGAAVLSGRNFQQLQTDIREAGLAGDDAAERFIAFTRAAGEQGIAAEKSSDILKDLSDRVGEFATTGKGQMKDLFDFIEARGGDLTIGDLEGKDSLEQLRLITGQLEALGATRDETKFLLEGISDEGSKLAAVFADGGARLEEIQKGVPEIDEGKLAETSTAVNDLTNTFKDLGLEFQTIAQEFLPAMADALDAIRPAVKSVAESIGGWAKAFSEMDPERQQKIVNVLGAFAVTGPIVIGLGAMVGGIGQIAAAFRVLAGVLKLGAGLAAANPYVAVFLGLVAAGTLIWQNWETISEVAERVWTGIADLMQPVIDKLQAIINAARTVGGAIASIFEKSSGEEIPGVANSATVGSGTNTEFMRREQERVGAVGGRGLIAGAEDALDINSPSRAFERIGQDVAEGLARGITGDRKRVEDATAAMAADVEAAARRALDSRSPSQVMARVGTDAGAGLAAGMDAGSDTIRGASERMAGDMLEPLKRGLTTGELRFESFADTVAGIMTRLSDRLLDDAFRPIENALSSLVSSGLASLTGGGGSSLLGPILPGLPGTAFAASAQGNVIADGRVQAFARGGVLNQPTFFPLRDRLGLAGEAGPEGILPLSRTRDGQLGVRAEGGRSVVRVELAAGLIGRVREQARDDAIEIVQANNREAVPEIAEAAAKGRVVRG